MRSSQFSKIVLALRAQLARKVGLPESRVGVCARREVPNLSGDQDLIIRVGGFQGDPAHDSRHDCRTKRPIDVTLRTRMALDQVGSDLQRLTKEATGLFDFEQTVLDAVQLFEPFETVDGQESALMVQPMRFTSGTAPTSDIKSADGLTWCEETVNINILFGQDFDEEVI